ncbi:MAG: hypothetical protein AAGE59_18745, partial [Cyanobacteria bacterium P01_F01_bin.86]
VNLKAPTFTSLSNITTKLNAIKIVNQAILWKPYTPTVLNGMLRFQTFGVNGWRIEAYPV